MVQPIEIAPLPAAQLRRTGIEHPTGLRQVVADPILLREIDPIKVQRSLRLFAGLIGGAALGFVRASHALEREADQRALAEQERDEKE